MKFSKKITHTKRIFSTPSINRYNHCVLSNSRIGLQVSRATVSDNAWNPAEGFYDFVINALRFPPKAPRSSFKSFEAITDPLCMIPFFKQWLSVCTLCFWNPNWSHKHNRLAISLWILLVICWPKEYISWEHSRSVNLHPTILFYQVGLIFF